MYCSTRRRRRPGLIHRRRRARARNPRHWQLPEDAVLCPVLLFARSPGIGKFGEVAASSSCPKRSKWFAPSSAADLRTPRRLRVSCMRKDPVPAHIRPTIGRSSPPSSRQVPGPCRGRSLSGVARSTTRRTRAQRALLTLSLRGDTIARRPPGPAPRPNTRELPTTSGVHASSTHTSAYRQRRRIPS